MNGDQKKRKKSKILQRSDKEDSRDLRAEQGSESKVTICPGKYTLYLVSTW